jgi:Sec-independent protein translocase protein TatA
MDTLCGIGLPEIIVLALLGFVLIGPERSREVALSLGRMLRTVLKSEWWQEINRIARAIQDLPNTLVRMAELEEALKTTERELQQTQDDLRRAVSSDVASPSPRPRGASPDAEQASPDREDG